MLFKSHAMFLDKLSRYINYGGFTGPTELSKTHTDTP